MVERGPGRPSQKEGIDDLKTRLHTVEGELGAMHEHVSAMSLRLSQFSNHVGDLKPDARLVAFEYFCRLVATDTRLKRDITLWARSVQRTKEGPLTGLIAAMVGE